MSKKAIIIVLTGLLLCGCGEYQKVLKSTDPDYKYTKALEYYGVGKYTQAQTLLEDIASYYRGTERSEDVLNLMARCTAGKKDYTGATEYYKIYLKNYPKGRYIIEARYMIGHCYYLNSPDARLDQEDTKQAIEYLGQFVDAYPDSPYAKQAYDELEQMYDKLALKEYNNAKLYYNLGTYLGNNYEACAVTAQNALRKYPGNKYQEEFSWLILKSKYEQVVRSVEERKAERAQDAIDECYNFLTEYPESSHRKETEKLQKELRKITK